METVACFCNIQHFHERSSVYTCCLYKKDLTNDTTFFGEHLFGCSNDDVRGIALANCQFSHFPGELAKIFPNLDHMAINGGLEQISKADLAGFENLKFLDLQGCHVEVLPADLFENTPNLEVIYFSHNRIASIGEHLLRPLTQLKYIDFRGNACIDEVYDEDKADDLSLDDLKALISEHCRAQNGIAASFPGFACET